MNDDAKKMTWRLAATVVVMFVFGGRSFPHHFTTCFARSQVSAARPTAEVASDATETIVADREIRLEFVTRPSTSTHPGNSSPT